ncbi:NAD(P)-dependent oxidoreductase [bacterium]|nr:NAD(P)-dependent oxidoreductase [bacterium]
MRVFVTGATGFIGSRVVTLLRERGHEVSALARDPAKAERLGIPRERIVAGDLFATGKMQQAIRGMDSVLHLAAEIATQRDEKRLWKIDVEGTDAVADACEGARLRSFVFASTVVVGDAKGAILRPEDPLPVTTAYGRAKQEAERRLKKTGLPLVVVRPSHVYGPGGWFGELVRDLRSWKRFLPGDGKNLWDTVHVDDVALALVLCAEKADPGIFHACDDAPIAMRDFFFATADALAVPRPRSIPVLLAKVFRGSGPIDAAVRSARSDNSRLKALGWSPRHPSSREAIPGVVAELLRTSP